MTEADRSAEYWRELSMRQVEVSRAVVFDGPRRERAFFEALAADNFDLGRPDSVELIFKACHTPTGRKPRTETRVQDQGGHPRPTPWVPNRSLRAQVNQLLGAVYTANQMS